MPHGLKVTPDQLQTLSGSVSRTSADVRGSHQNLKGQLSPLFGADWSGQASAQFTTLYDQFDQHAKGLSDALDGIGQLLGSSRRHVRRSRTADRVVLPLTRPAGPPGCTPARSCAFFSCDVVVHD